MKNFSIKSLQKYIAETDNKIVCCEADGRYTRIYFDDNKHETIPAHLKVIEQLVKDKSFFRSHKSHIVNLKCIIGVNYNKGSIYLKNGYVADISRRKDTELKYLRANNKIIPGFDYSRKNFSRTK